MLNNKINGLKLKNEILKKKYSITITLLICTSLILIPIQQAKTFQTKNLQEYYANGKTMYVGGSGPGNFTKIQTAINHTIDGDTVFVYSGNYHENIIVNKSINIIGEDNRTTSIYGGGKKSVVNLTKDFVKINGFSISYSGQEKEDAAILLTSNYSQLSNNIIFDNYIGILLKNSSNNFLLNNIVKNNYYGIIIDLSSKNNSINDNTISNNKDGIDIGSNCNNTRILNNNISYNEYDGIWITSSHNNTIIDNVFINNFRGLYLYDKTNYNRIKNNLFFCDGLVVRNSFKNNILNNKVNGKPIVHFENQSNKLIDEDCGQIIVVNCDNISIKNQTISNVYLALVLVEANFCRISENQFFNNINGLNLYNSGNNEIMQNTFNQNTWNSIYLSKSKNNVIYKNQISSTDEFSGIDLWDYSNSTIISGNNFSNNAYGIHVYNTSNTYVFNNNFSNDHYGICLWFYCFNTTIFSNNIVNCRDGIWLYNAKYNNVTKNFIKNSNYDGIWLYNSSYNRISSNSITNCTCGVEFAYSNNNVINDNILEKGGFFVYFSFENFAFGNKVNSKSLEYFENKTDIKIQHAGQVILVGCENISFKKQELTDTIIGFQLWWSDDCKIFYNNISNNFYGGWIIYSNNNIIFNNNISNYKNKGLYVYSSDNNTFSKNTINSSLIKARKKILIQKELMDYCHYWNTLNLNDPHRFLPDDTCGMTVVYSNHNNILKNKINSNLEYGIFLYISNYNSIVNNIFINNYDGIIIENSKNNNVSLNYINISDNHGLHFIDSDSNLVSNNIFSHNNKGIMCSNSSQNFIFKNIFKNNQQNAYFEYCKNKWRGNFWDRGRFLPKIIFGKIKLGITHVKWINVDWIPARE